MGSTKLFGMNIGSNVDWLCVHLLGYRIVFYTIFGWVFVFVFFFIILLSSATLGTIYLELYAITL